MRPVIASPRRINPQFSPVMSSGTAHERLGSTQKIAFMVKMALTVWRFALFRRILADFIFIEFYG
ncbi:MAG: hypothetical protein OEL78_04025 [Hyphomicrobiales bacterium]|nr:hypothetical protein [Hyphomicrobiales bacterium]